VRGWHLGKLNTPAFMAVLAYPARNVADGNSKAAYLLECVDAGLLTSEPHVIALIKSIGGEA
jgi:hypothetical protein